MTPVQRVLEGLQKVRPNRDGWIACCPAHDDRNPSLSVSEGEDGRALLHCHAGCGVDAIVAALGLRMADLMMQPDVQAAADRPRVSRVVAEYVYKDEDGRPLFKVVRRDNKTFPQFRWDGRTFVPGLSNVRRVLYHLDALARARPKMVAICEGEKDCDALKQIRVTATSNPMGAGSWRDDYAAQLVACGVGRVAIFPDNDAAGEDHAITVAESCRRAGLFVKIVRLPNLPKKGDVSDWLAGGGTAADLVTLVDETPDWDGESAPAQVVKQAGDAPDEQLVLRELATHRARYEARRRFDAEQRPPLMLPDFETLADRLSRPRVGVEWRIDGWQPAGARVMLVAQFKAGKTTLVGNLTRSLVDGDAFLGAARVKPVSGTVALLDFEMGDNQIDSWLRDQRIRATDRVLVVGLRGRAASFNILDPTVRAAWVRRLRDHHVRYLVVDCLRPILDALGLDEHKDAGRFLVALDALLNEAGIDEAVLVHHMGHGSERARGDSRLRDWPDAEWRLVRHDDQPDSERYITAYGRDVDVPETRLGFDRATRHLRLDGGSRRDAAALAALVDVRAVLKAADGGPMSGRKIEAALRDSDHPRGAVRQALKLGQRPDGGLVKVDGASNSKEYTLVSAPVRGGAPPVRQITKAECAGAPVPIRHGALAHSNGGSPSLPPPRTGGLAAEAQSEQF